MKIQELQRGKLYCLPNKHPVGSVIYQDVNPKKDTVYWRYDADRPFLFLGFDFLGRHRNHMSDMVMVHCINNAKIGWIMVDMDTEFEEANG
jgi:hypothetical protein